MKKYVPPFSITNEIVSLVSTIMEKIGRINSYENLSKYPILRKQNRIKSIHSSCAIEANSLSIEQVSDVINGANVIGPQKDIIEIKNAIKAYDSIAAINPFSVDDLKKTHFLIGKDVVTLAGQYRSGNEGVSDENGNIIFVAPPPRMVSSHMDNLITWANENFETINPLLLSSIFHYEFVFIHPFTDGNGRMARLWQNAILGKWKPIFYWLPLESYVKKYQDEYYSSISKSHREGNANAFVTFMLKMIDYTFDALISDAALVNKQYSIQVNKLLKAMREDVWYTANEILDLLKLKSKETLRKNYLDPAINNKLIILELPDKPTSRNQRYKII